MNEKQKRIALETLKNKSWYEKIIPLFRMISASFKGEFKMRKRYIIVLILSLVYVISPIDFIPGWVFPIIGVTDDLGVFFLSIGYVMKEVNRFMEWEIEQKTGVKTFYIEED